MGGFVAPYGGDKALMGENCSILSCSLVLALRLIHGSEASSHDPIFGGNYYSISKKLVTRIDISMGRNNTRKIIRSNKCGSCELTFRAFFLSINVLY